ncbi:MAG: hypothetical protein ACFFCS_20780, partial [Candidatus Hodarchaeota archaeon]
MAKTKRIMAECTACDKMVAVNVPADAAEGKDYYPFEYIDIHGDPEHALMLFLDRNLNLRDSMVYTNLRIAKEKGKEFQKLTRMTENEALAAIYEDPLRLKVFLLLTEGPKKTDDIIDALKKEKDFKESDFNFLILPLIKIGMVKSSWLKETFSECYFL